MSASPIGGDAGTHSRTRVLPGAWDALGRTGTHSVKNEEKEKNHTVGQSTPEQNTAYRSGLCVDCNAVRYSAGRPRCETCHAVYVSRHVFDPRLTPDVQPCSNPSCTRPTQPGRVTCATGPMKRKRAVA